MRIGLTIEHFDARRGGVEHWTVQFVRRLVARGHEVNIVARSAASDRHVAGITVHLIDTDASRMAFADAAAQKLSSLRLDVVHDTGCGWYADVFQPHGGSRTASFEQNLRLMSPPLRPLKRVAARLLPRYREFQQLLGRQYGDHRRLFIALSRMVSRDLVQYHDVPTEQIRIVYNGVDTQRFDPQHRHTHRAITRGGLGMDDNEVLLLILAHNFRLKGVATAIRSAARLKREGLPVHLAVAGGGRIGPYRRLAERCGVADRVHFLGAVDDPVPLYAAADVYVQPTWYDPCSLVVLEALAAGLPVVTTRYNGAGELITPGREGDVLDDPGDDLAWAECLSGYFDRPRHKLMQAAARRLAERHDLDHNCDEMIAAYQEQVAGRRAA